MPYRLTRNGLGTLRRSLARDSLHAFTRLGWRYASFPGDFQDGWHIHLIARELERVTRSGRGRILLNAPPRSTKSAVVSVFWPAWTWLQDNDMSVLAGDWVQFMYISHREDLALRDSRRTRSLIRTDWYRSLLDPEKAERLQVRDDADTMDYFSLLGGGDRRAVSIKSGITGHDTDIQVFEDPHDAGRVESAAERRQAKQFFDEEAPSRVNHPVRNAQIVSCQRTHADDLSAHILGEHKGEFDHVCIPGIYPGEGEEFPHRLIEDEFLGRHPRFRKRQPGEVYWPQRFTTETLNSLVRTAYGRAAQIQQHPQKRGLSLFKDAHWVFRKEAPRMLQLVRYWDKAATAEGKGSDPDYTCGCLGGVDDNGLFWILDMVRGRWSPRQVEERIRLTATQVDPKNTQIWIEEEPGSAGKDVTDRYQRIVLPGFPVRGDRPTGPKLVRCDAFIAAAEAGNVVLLEGDWNAEFIAECDVFTGDDSTHDDQVIAATGCHAKAALMHRMPLVW